MSDITIFHNPDCGTSRNVLALIRHARIEPHVIEFLKTPPSTAEIRSLLAAMGMTVRELLREKGTSYALRAHRARQRAAPTLKRVFCRACSAMRSRKASPRSI